MCFDQLLYVYKCGGVALRAEAWRPAGRFGPGPGAAGRQGALQISQEKSSKNLLKIDSN